MKRTWLTRGTLLGVAVFCLSGLMLAQNAVTFRVNMKIKMREGTFQPGSGDIVRVAGGFNNWGSSTDTLRDVAPIDSIYEKSISLPTGAIAYKFLKTLRGGLDWEADPNRSYTVTSGTQTLPVVYFDNDSVYTPPVSSPVTFRVNMRIKRLEGTFRPDLGDIVRVAGSFNDWGNSRDTLVDVAPTDSIYQKTINLLEGSAVQYKFLKTARGGVDWEGFADNRTYTVPAGGGTPGTPYFDNDSVYNFPITANIVYRIDMRALQQIGWFDPARDSVQARGGFDGWGGTRINFNAISGLFQSSALPYTGTSNDLISHKFFMKVDSATALVRFPGYLQDADETQYDHPYTRGDGNRQFNVGSGGNLVTPSFYFSDINRNGLLLNPTDSVNVTFRVNMTGARSLGFNPATDTVRMVFTDGMWWRSQSRNQGITFALRPRMTRIASTDSFQVTIKVKGRAHYGLMYVYRFDGPSGGVEEGAGLGAQGGRRIRFIQPSSPNTFPANYTAPYDGWQRSAPLPGETPPYLPTDVRPDDEAGVPLEFSLSQNYPNPFNPTTAIKYSIPTASRVVLKIYNMLGQELTTLVNEDQAKGNYVATFNAGAMASGVYFYKIEAGSFTQTRKMMLLK